MQSPATPRLYHDLAYLWPLISPPEDYRSEAEFINQIITEKLQQSSRRRTLLELGAGGGHTICHLGEAFETTAVDMSERMLENCRHLNPDTKTIVADMRSMELDHQFDIILLHDAVDYMCTCEDVFASLRTIRHHLKQHGLAIVAPTYTVETFIDGDTEYDLRSDKHMEVTYLSYVHDPDPSDTMIELILTFLIREQGHVQVETDRHHCGLFSMCQWQTMFYDSGLRVEPVKNTVVEMPHHLFVCTKT